jgi:signal transduction histidine kinase
VHADVLRLARLAEDLLLLARLDEQAGAAGANGTAGGANGTAGEANGTAGGANGPVDLVSLSRSVACRYADARVPVTVRPTPDAASGDAGPGPTVLAIGDQGRLERLLVNLVDNAVRYARSSVVVSARRDGTWAELSVTDDGPGIPSADRDWAFGRFTRLDDARSRDGAEAGGAGLGLAIVRATAQAYGGSAHLEAAPAAGLPADGAQRPGAAGLRAVVRLPGATAGYMVNLTH